MQGKPVKFKNANTLYPELLSEENLHGESQSEVLLPEIKEREIREVFLILKKQESAQHLQNILEESGISVYRIDLERISSGDFEYIRQTNARLLNHLKANPVMVGYESLDSTVMNYLVTILLSLRSKKLTPEKCVRLFSGQESHSIDLTVANGYESFLFEESTSKSQETVETAAPKTIASHSEKKTEEESLPPLRATGKTRRLEMKVTHPDPIIADKEETFKPSRFTLRVKLASITSAIIFIAATLMIFPATELFRDNISVLIQEYNLSLARMSSKKIQDEFHDLIYRLENAGALSHSKRGKETVAPKDIQKFFSDNPQFIYISSVREKLGVPAVQWKAINRIYSENYNIPAASFTDLERNIGSFFLHTNQNETVFENMSPRFNIPVIVIAIPDESDPNRMYVAAVDSSSLMESFRSTRASDIFQYMLVNNDGSLIAHTDDAVTIAKPDLSDMPVVKSMMESGSKNGSPGENQFLHIVDGDL